MGCNADTIKIKGIKSPLLTFTDFKEAFYSTNAGPNDYTLDFEQEDIYMQGFAYKYRTTIKHVNLQSYTKRI